ncbi:hypothetical protein G6030_10870, partial [Dietzia sp. E1]|uniref:hypothetical protein n=1 Tax=Dietzia sp. E1 TaxID=328361 RepID=UPI0015FC1113
VGLIARRRTAVLGAGDLDGTTILLPDGAWAVRPDGTTISGRVDVGELLSASPVVVIVRED